MDERTKITKEEFEFFYKASNGNYSQIARDFDLAYFTLGKILEGTSWYSKEKYPSLGRNLHYVTEEEFKKIYKKNNGIYRKIKFDLGYNDDETLSKRLRIYPWFNTDKYPSLGINRKKYNFTKKEFENSYVKNKGSYKLIADDLGINHNSIGYAFKKMSWWSRDKYPPSFIKTKRIPKANVEINEDDFSKLYIEFNGNYTAIANNLSNINDSVSASSLIRSLEKYSWYSKNKFPPMGRNKYSFTESDFIKYYKKHKGNYVAIRNIEFDMYDRDLFLELLQKQSWWSREKYPPMGGLKKSNPVRIKSNPQNLINVKDVEDFIAKGIKDKNVNDKDVIGWLNSTFRKHLINVVPSEEVKKIPKDSPDWMKTALASGSLRKAKISSKLKEEYYHTLDFILEKKPKLGSAIEVLAKVDAWDKAMANKRRKFEARMARYGSGASNGEMGEIKLIDELDNGYSIVQLMDDKAKDWEGVAMGHCVGGHEYESATILSLRDKKLMPHATIQIDESEGFRVYDKLENSIPEKSIPTVIQVQGKENKPVVKKYQDILLNWLEEKEYDIPDEAYANLGRIHVFGHFKKSEEIMNQNYKSTISGSYGYMDILIDEYVRVEDFENYIDFYYYQDLWFNPSLDIKLPKNLTVDGVLDLSRSSIKELPENLTVNGGLDLSQTSIKKLPDNLYVEKDIDLSSSDIEHLPDNFTVNGNLYLTHSKIKKLPKNLKIKENLNLIGTDVEQLPPDLFIGGDLFVSTKIKIPESVEIVGKYKFMRVPKMHYGPHDI